MKKTRKRMTALKDLTTANFLIGATLIDINNDSIALMKDGKVITIDYYNEGSYSDWWEVKTKLLISKSDLSKNPIITNIKQNGNSYNFVLFGLNRPIAEINAEFHNDSDWDYGCTCSIYANEKELVCWHG